MKVGVMVNVMQLSKFVKGFTVIEGMEAFLVRSVPLSAAAIITRL